ncbi:MAG: hypothetical protein IJW03_01195 [Clostridia bacterium]|nr:hypothetical protein [Clostridia bacterium]
MKKILSLILILTLALGALVGCSFGNSGDGKKEPTLSDALVALDALYKGENGKDSTEDFVLVGSVTVDGTSFSVSWTSDNEKITVSRGDDGNYTVTLPSTNDEAFIYSLVATVTNGADEHEIYSFTKNLPILTAGGGNNKPTPPVNNGGTTGGETGGETGGTTGGETGGSTGGGTGGTQATPLTAVTELALDTPYYIASADSTGTLYFNGTLSGGLLSASGEANGAMTVKLESAGADGKYYIYFMSEGVKTYIGANTSATTKTAGFKTATATDDDFVWVISADSQTIMSESFTNRGMASRLDASDNAIRTYSANNFGAENYYTAWFVHAGSGSTGGTTGGGTTGGGSSSGAEIDGTYTYTFSAKVFGENGTQNLGGIDWTLAGEGGYWGYDSTKGQQFGSAKKAYGSMTLTSEAIAGIKEIRISTCGASSIVGTLIVYVNGTQLDQPVNISDSTAEYVFDSATALDGEITFEFLQSSSKAIYIKSITIVTE